MTGQPRHKLRLIAGLIPDATGGITDPQVLQALRERYQLIENRADAILDRDIKARAAWLHHLPRSANQQQWRATARLTAAYRDRWHITSPSPLGPRPDGAAPRTQHADHRRASNALAMLHTARVVDTGQPAARTAGRSL